MRDALGALLADRASQNQANLSGQLLSGERLWYKRYTRIEFTFTDDPSRRKSRHINHADTGPAAENRFSELLAAQPRHSDVSENAVDAVGRTLQDSYGFFSAARLEYVISLFKQDPRSQSPHYFFVVNNKQGLAGR
jgi:hypothetical protein